MRLHAINADYVLRTQAHGKCLPNEKEKKNLLLPGLWYRPSYCEDGAGPGSRGTHSSREVRGSARWRPGLCGATMWKGVGGLMKKKGRQEVRDQGLILPLAHWEILSKHIPPWPV